MNLSVTLELDTLKLTDALASEFLSFSSVSVVPVNLTLAALAQRGKTFVETPQDACDLAREFSADATIVTAVTEFDPYDPPVVGLIMQWYVPSEHIDTAAHGPAEPGAGASRPEVDLGGTPQPTPRYQLQRVFNAADNQVRDELRRYAGDRQGRTGPYGWQRFARAQELYVRYCCWAMIRSMLALDGSPRAALPAEQVDS